MCVCAHCGPGDLCSLPVGRERLSCSSIGRSVFSLSGNIPRLGMRALLAIFSLSTVASLGYGFPSEYWGPIITGKVLLDICDSIISTGPSETPGTVRDLPG